MTAPRVLLEVAVQSLADAQAAAANGADRLELCSALELGGLTPSHALLSAVCAAVELPTVVLIRPRPGGFCYTADELRVMCGDIAWALGSGAAAVSVGALTRDGRLDEPACRTLLEAAAGRSVVCHRAFDLTDDPCCALERLVALGFRRVLTSGGAPQLVASDSAEHEPPVALQRIAALRGQAAGRIEILPAGGIRASNVAAVLRATRCTQVHASCSSAARDAWPLRSQGGFGFAATSDDAAYRVVDPAQVAALRAALDAANV